MNKTLLLIICDFLLLSLLAFVKFEPEEEPPPEIVEQADERATDELLDILKLSLENEQQLRDALSEQLETTQETLEDRQARLQVAEADLEDTRMSLEEQERLAAELEKRKAALEKETRALEMQKTESQAKAEELARRVTDTEKQLNLTAREREQLATEAAAAKERSRLVQEQLKKRESELARAAEQTAALREEHRMLQQEKQTLSTELQVTRAEKSAVEQSLVATEMAVVRERREKETIQEQAGQLAQGVTVLAENSTEISERIQKLHSLTANEIYQLYASNSARIIFIADAGPRTLTSQARTVFASDGTRTFALMHAGESPVNPGSTGRLTPDALRVYLRKGNNSKALPSLAYLKHDPRIMAAEIPDAWVKEFGISPFMISSEPLRFPEAVLIGRQEDRYGEISFSIEPGTPGFLKMDKAPFSSILGKFLPAEGDFVFTKTGEFMGLMINRKFNALLMDFSTAQTIGTGENYSKTDTQAATTQLRERIHQMDDRLR